MLLGPQEVQSVVGGGHIGHLDVVLHAGGCDLFGRIHADVVLHGGGHIHIHVRGAPVLGTGHELAAEVVGVGLAVHGILGTHLQNEVQLLLGVDAVGIVDIAIGAGHIGDLGTQLSGLLHDAPSHVAVAGQGDALALDGVALVLEDLLQIVDSAVAGGLRTSQGAAIGQALAGQNAVLEGALQAAILAIQVADLTAAHAHVAGGNVNVGPDVTIQSGHEALAETHDLCVGLAGGIEVSAALAAADGQTGQGVLEDLLEAQELDDAGIHVGLEAQAALIGAKSTIELAAIADVGVGLAGVVGPHNTEGEHTLGLNHTAQQVNSLVLGVCGDNGVQRAQDFFNGLHELGLTAVLFLNGFNNAFDISIHDVLAPSLIIYFYLATPGENTRILAIWKNHLKTSHLQMKV